MEERRRSIRVTCESEDCQDRFWVDCLDERLPNGPFLCHEHDPHGLIVRRDPTFH